MVTLQNWSVREGTPHYYDPWLAPEQREQGGDYLYIVADYPPKEGEQIRTSRLVSSEGRVVTTKSGSRYKLGRVCPRYRKWLTDQGLEYDRRQPVKLLPVENP